MGDVVLLASRRPVYLSEEDISDLLGQVEIEGLRVDREGRMLEYVANQLDVDINSLSCTFIACELRVDPRTVRRYSRILQDLGLITVTGKKTAQGGLEYNTFSIRYEKLLQLAFGSEWRTIYDDYLAEKNVLSGRTLMSIPTDKTV